MTTIQCSDRQDDDGRTRTPFSQSGQLDPLRVKGGINDYCVLGVIDVQALRRFQSSYKSPEGPFKPLPEGLAMMHQRKALSSGDAA